MVEPLNPSRVGRSPVLIIILVSVSLMMNPLHAELRTADPEVFTQHSVRLGFGTYGGSRGLDPEDLLADWGIRLSGPERPLEIDAWTPKAVINILPPIYPVAKAREEHPGLVVESARPLKRIGLSLVNDLEGGSGETLDVIVTAQDSLGRELGTYESAMPPGTFFVGLEDVSGISIARVVVDYAGSEPEKLVGLWLEYVERPVFKTYIAHLGDGILPSGESFTSALVVTNLSSSTAQGQIEFFDDLGEPLLMEMEGEIWEDRIPLSIPARTSKHWTTAGATPSVRAGSAHITTNVPVAATVRFSNLDSQGRVIAEAGIASSRAEAFVLAPVRRRLRSGLVGGSEGGDAAYSTAVAIANPGNEAVRVRLRGLPGRVHDLELPPRAHWARLLEELLPDRFLDSDLDAVIEITASHPIGVTLLHTREGRANASLPATGRLR